MIRNPSKLAGALALALVSAPFVLAACVNPSIQVRNDENQCGGTLVISGSRFTPGGHVTFVASGTPGGPATEMVGMVQANGMDGSFTARIPYNWPGFGNPLPGCASGSSAVATVTIVATDQTTTEGSEATVQIRNCGTEWSECPL